MGNYKNKTTIKKNDCIKKCQDGTPCRYQLGYQDVPNKFGDLKFRAAFTFISFVILQFNQTGGNYFFTGLLMFSGPMFYDNIKFSPIETSRRIIKNLLMTALLIHIFIGVLGLIGVINCVAIGDELIIQISKNNLVFRNVEFKLVTLWWSIGAEVVLTIADTIVAQPGLSRNENLNQFA